MLDAYTVKKAMPRIVLAIIAINLSIYLCVAAIDISVVVGHGLNQLLVGPFVKDESFQGVQLEGNIENSILGVLGITGVLGTLIIAVWGAIGAAFSATVALIGLLGPLIITIALIALAILFTLIIRQALLIFLTVISPIAIVCYILPGTEKYFKQWGDQFVRTLAVYPIIAVIFAMCNVMAAILLNAASTNGSGASMLKQNIIFAAEQSDTIGMLQIITAILVLYMPLVLIPFSFKLAGGAIGAVFNAANQQANKLSSMAGDKIRKSREDQNSFLGKHAYRAKTNRWERGATAGQIATGLHGGARSFAAGRGFRSGYSDYSGQKGNAALMAAKDKIKESDAVKRVMKNDDLVWAWQHGTDEDSVREILKSRGYRPQDLGENVAAVMEAKSQGSDAVNKMAAFEAQAATGTGFEDQGQFLTALKDASRGSTTVMGELLAGAREGAKQAGRIDQGNSSYGVHYANARDFMSGKKSLDAATSDIMSSTVDSTQGAMALQGKPESSREIANGWNRRLKQNRARLKDAENRKRIAKNVTGDKQAYAQAERDRKAAEQDQMRSMAQLAGIQDAMGSSAPQNAREFSNRVFGTEMRYSDMSETEKKMFAKGFDSGENLRGRDGELVKNANGDYVNAAHEKIMVSQAISSVRGNAEFNTMRREYGAEADAARAGQVAGAEAEARGVDPFGRPL